MDYSHPTTSSHVKGKHLSYEDRVLIQIRLKDNYSIRQLPVRSAAHRALSRMK
jgi:IS30 family transposase